MKFICPSCNLHLQAEAELAGKAVKCPGCGTKIQIPATLGSPPAAPPPPDAALHEKSHGADDEEEMPEGEGGEMPQGEGEGMTESYHEEFQGLDMSRGTEKTHPTEIKSTMALLAATGLTFFWYIIMFMLPKQTDPEAPATVANYLREMFTERSWPQYSSTYMMFFCTAILILKLTNLRRQRRAMLIDALPSDIDEEISAQNVGVFHEHILNFPKPLRHTLIVNRIRKALEFFYIRQNNPEVAQMVTSMSEVDISKVSGSYSMVKVLLWAIPIMGFIGTVLGIGAAIGGFGAVLGGEASDMNAIKGPLMAVLSNLAVAFDTTLLALVFSILLSFPASALQSAEEDLVTDVDQYCIDNLLKRLNDGGAGSSFGGDAGLLKALGDAIASNQKDMLSKFTDVQGLMASNLDKQLENYQKVAAAVDAQMEGMEKRTEKYEKRLDKDFFDSLDRIRILSVQAIENQVKPLGEGIQNLNKVLKELNGKQVVVKKRGWFGR